MKINNFKFFFYCLAIFFSLPALLSADDLTKKEVTIKNNERFELIDQKHIKFKFQPLSEEAKVLEITEDASSLGVTYLGKLQLKGDFTALSALRSIADQIGKSLDLSFGVIADSNSSDALKANELLLLYHPQAIITLSLVKIDQESPYEIICTYTLKDLSSKETVVEAAEITIEKAEAAKQKELATTADSAE